MLARQIETGKKLDIMVAPPARLLTPIGERICNGETITYQEFYTQSLPANDKFLIDFCSNLTSSLADEARKTAKDRYISFIQRGSNVRRGCWNLVSERAGHPVGDYLSITRWWENYFKTEAGNSSPDSYHHTVKQFLTHSPVSEIDLRLEFLLSGDRFDYKTNRRGFADFAANKVPGIIGELVFNTRGDLGVKGDYFIKGVPPFAGIDSGYPTYIGHIFHFYQPESDKPILTLDFGTGNGWRNTLYEAHNVEEPYLVAKKDGLALPENIWDKNHLINLIAQPFGSDYSGSLYTADHGLKGYDILTCGTRQTYIGAFYDPSNTPYIDPITQDVINSLKEKHKKINQFRAPEITVNSIVAQMADPIYTFTALRQTDYYRQFPKLAWLADDTQKQIQLESAIEKRMISDNFIDGVWDPFLIIDAFNEIAYPVKRNFSGLVKLLKI